MADRKLEDKFSLCLIRHRALVTWRREGCVEVYLHALLTCSLDGQHHALAALSLAEIVPHTR